MTQSLRTLRLGEPSQVRRELRKLHIRWWHATRTQMEKILLAARCPQSVVRMVADIIDTCRECRAWASAAAQVTPSVELATAPDQEVEADILFFRQYPIWHMLDRADRWHAAKVLEGQGEAGYRSTESLCSAILACWISIFGPFKHLIIDGERAF